MNAWRATDNQKVWSEANREQPRERAGRGELGNGEQLGKGASCGKVKDKQCKKRGD